MDVDFGTSTGSAGRRVVITSAAAAAAASVDIATCGSSDASIERRSMAVRTIFGEIRFIDYIHKVAYY